MFIGWIFSFICDFLTVFGPAVGYGFQYFEIERVKSSAGFAPQVCLIVMLSMVARMHFWLVKEFALPILLQAVCLFVSQVKKIFIPILDFLIIPVVKIPKEKNRNFVHGKCLYFLQLFSHIII